MKVILQSYTPRPLIVAATAARTCYSELEPSQISLSVKEAEKILDKTIRSGHESVLEHVVFTFYISGVSRVLTHQLVRHRMASYSQQSQRYVNMSDASYVTPHNIDDTICVKDFDSNISRKDLFEDAMTTAWCTYNSLIESGVPEEDARYILPGACLTNIVVTMNARELLHFFKLRLCNRAQKEIREMAELMLKECMLVAPEIFKYAGAPCQVDKCHETKPCGHPKKKAKW